MDHSEDGLNSQKEVAVGGSFGRASLELGRCLELHLGAVGFMDWMISPKSGKKWPDSKLKKCKFWTCVVSDCFAAILDHYSNIVRSTNLNYIIIVITTHLSFSLISVFVTHCCFYSWTHHPQKNAMVQAWCALRRMATCCWSRGPRWNDAAESIYLTSASERSGSNWGWWNQRVTGWILGL